MWKTLHCFSSQTSQRWHYRAHSHNISRSLKGWPMSSYWSRLSRIESGAYWARFLILFSFIINLCFSIYDILWQVRSNYFSTQKQLQKLLILQLFLVKRQVCGLCELWSAKHFSWVRSWTLSFPSYCISHRLNASSTLIHMYWFIFPTLFFIFCCRSGLCWLFCQFWHC